ncbi:glycosyltransferase family 1 protein [Simkania negevensis]|uniref:Glycosyltransferase family 1 protein n=1 Tax=Simkania negevensis TaxID=83561 RepID=A0ABS3ASF5_9BACT|nr:glycosyltransferase family 1 protein [Simkania negevensis]
MRVAIQSPLFLFGDQKKNYNGFDFAFFKLFKPAIYLPGKKKLKYPRLRQRIRELGLNPNDYEFILSPWGLNRKIDALICFAGRADLPAFAPVKGFHGLKVYHLMDYVFQADRCKKNLVDAGVDYVMGYTDHGKYCPFFHKHYPQYIDKVIPVPFGFGERFQRTVPFQERKQKVIAAGSVNPVRDPMVKNPDDLKEYTTFYQDEEWTHRWRRKLAENTIPLQSMMESVLPQFPKTKDFSYDVVSLFNQYQMFANDEGLLAFPPARTYEGAAVGCTMIAAHHPCYTDLGFEDGVNCILHNPLDLDDFKERTVYYQEHQNELERIAEAGYNLVTSRYTHEKVAHTLFNHIKGCL